MKKRILALLLAGLITASLASCVSSGTQNEPDNDTEAEQTQDESTTPRDEEDTDPIGSEWTSVDETVFTTSQVSMREEPDTSGDIIKALAKETQLHRTRVNEDWSYVETADGETGYVSNKYVTSVNILGTDFTAIEGGEKIMYATDVLNVRLYPCADTFSDKMGSYKKDDEVIVVATNGKWYRVKYTAEGSESPKYYYVNASYVATEKGASSGDASQYEPLFTALTEEKVMYANGQVNIRTTPVANKDDNSNLIATLKRGAKVIVMKEGTVDGQKWVYAKAEVEQQGEKIDLVEGYIFASYLNAETAPESMTLDELVSYYGFTKTAKTLYIIKGKSLNVRSTPSTANSDNYVGTLSSKDSAESEPTKVNVVAQGKVDKMSWYIITYVDGETTSYRFISASATYTTANPSGEWKLTLENFNVTYSEYTVLETPVAITATRDVKGFATPETAENAPFSIKSGEKATLVAKESDKEDRYAWFVIQTTDGTLYFVSGAYFTGAASNG